MKTMTFECDTHGTFEIDLRDNQDPPTWCPIYEADKIPCGEVLKRRYDVPSNSEEQDSTLRIIDEIKVIAKLLSTWIFWVCVGAIIVIPFLWLFCK